MPAALTFSGIHNFRRGCLLGATLGQLAAKREIYEVEAHPEDDGYAERLVDRLVDEIDRGICPRCKGPLSDNYPAGSRITVCRCIPVCSACGSHEASCRLPGHPFRFLSRSGIWSGPLEWVDEDPEAVESDIEVGRPRSRTAILDERLRRPAHEPRSPKPRLGGWLDPDNTIEREED